MGVGDFRESLVVRLVGPALAAAELTKEGGDIRRWRVAYRVWDAGNYSVLVLSECGSLDFTRNSTERALGTVAEWTLTVFPSVATAPSSSVFIPFADSSTSNDSIRIESSDGADYNEYQDTPCDHSAYGRWFFDPPKGKYTWQLYPCAQPLPPPCEWISALQSRGIYEVNIVGDSHQRFLFNYLFFLLTGEAYESDAKKYDNMMREVMPSRPPSPPLLPPSPPAPSASSPARPTTSASDPVSGTFAPPSPSAASALAADVPATPAATTSAPATEEASHGSNSSQAAELRPLKLNFYWLAGIYNVGQHGCKKGLLKDGRWFPKVSPAADVTIIDGGSWTHAFCELCSFDIDIRTPAGWDVTPPPDILDVARGATANLTRNVVRTSNNANSSGNGAANHAANGGGNGGEKGGREMGVGDFRESLVVRLVGPALATADVAKEGGDIKKWRVSYRVWDAGNYSVLLLSECGTLDFTRNSTERALGTVAEWSLTVLPTTVTVPSSFALNPFSDSSTSTDSVQIESPSISDYNEYQDTPCYHSVYGRWLFDLPKGKYTWQLYPCAQPLLPPSEWLSALQSRGINEINIVGDSHQRFLFNHLIFLLTGEAYASDAKTRGNMMHEVFPSPPLPPPSPPSPPSPAAPSTDQVSESFFPRSPGASSAPAAELPDAPAAAASAPADKGTTQGSNSNQAAELRPLKLNFYWIAGIYNVGQHGCK
ncbi:unnamed protein product [Closterium sp. NIES-64]|nr:unnamed protein product [Closterium sp. NIES-64]